MFSKWWSALKSLFISKKEEPAILPFRKVPASQILTEAYAKAREVDGQGTVLVEFNKEHGGRIRLIERQKDINFAEGSFTDIDNAGADIVIDPTNYPDKRVPVFASDGMQKCISGETRYGKVPVIHIPPTDRELEALGSLKKDDKK
jgi:hypothetical protein